MMVRCARCGAEREHDRERVFCGKCGAVLGALPSPHDVTPKAPPPWAVPAAICGAVLLLVGVMVLSLRTGKSPSPGSPPPLTIAPATASTATTPSAPIHVQPVAAPQSPNPRQLADARFRQLNEEAVRLSQNHAYRESRLRCEEAFKLDSTIELRRAASDALHGDLQQRILGLWIGMYGKDSATLEFTKLEDDTAIGILTEQARVRVVCRFLTPPADAIEMVETEVLSNQQWSLGTNRGTVSPDGTRIEGTGSDGRHRYRWAFTRRTKP